MPDLSEIAKANLPDAKVVINQYLGNIF